jgi:TRAP-type mannitol/chloroaromatic compound transport system permease small subunit
MGALLGLSRGIDKISGTVGRAVAWLVLVAVLISCGNAISRYAFNIASNAWLEAQWYLFGAVFMLGAAFTMKRNEHVRVDVVSSRLPKRSRDWIELFGLIVFFFPFALAHLYYSWPYFTLAWVRNEWSTSPGGLPVWPAKFLLVIGFALLALQGVSQLIKRIAILRGDLQEDDEMMLTAAQAAEIERANASAEAEARNKP